MKKTKENRKISLEKTRGENFPHLRLRKTTTNHFLQYVNHFLSIHTI